MKQDLKKYINKLLDFLYPQSCMHCQEAHSGENIFCVGCSTQIIRLNGPCCFICSTPFVSFASTSHSPSHRCDACRKAPPPFSKAITPLLYEGPLATAIRQFKYQKKNHLAVPLARLIAHDLAHLSIDYVMPIPLSPSRLRSREFNQSLLLAQQIGRVCAVPYLIDAMIRIRETPPQVGLSRKERDQNIKGAFHVTTPNAIKARRILLIDDVYTTGATVKEGARMLMQAGAQDVVVATVARMVLGQR